MVFRFAIDVLGSAECGMGMLYVALNEDCENGRHTICKCAFCFDAVGRCSSAGNFHAKSNRPAAQQAATLKQMDNDTHDSM